MKRATLVALAALILVSLAYADDVWKGKPYQQWGKRAAAHVVIPRVPGGKPDDPRSIAAIVFYFAKKTAPGDPLLSRNTKSVEFVCPSAGATIKASFDLSKMAGANGPDW